MRYHNIQVLRIVAAAAVVVMHVLEYSAQHFGTAWLDDPCRGTWRNFPVPLFFAISGFVLAQSVRGTGTGSYLWARALRLYPGFWLATLIVAVLRSSDGGIPFLTQVAWIGWTLRPGELGSRLFVLGPEWTLMYEATLSLCLAFMGAFRPKWVLPAIAAAWLGVLAAKIALWPGYAMDAYPSWGKFFLSPLTAPFLLGILTYFIRDVGGSRKWFVAIALAAFLALVPGRMQNPETLWCAYSAAGTATVWLAVQFPQLSPSNLFVRAGEWSYGLYLVHVPLIIASIDSMNRTGLLAGTGAGVLLAGTVSMGGGVLAGLLEVRLYRRLRKAKWSAIAAACGRRLRGAGSLPATLSGRFAGSR